MRNRKKKYDHITPILASLHWLPVHLKIQFKILLFVFKALNNRAPSYLKVLLIPLSTTRHLRSNDRALLSVPRSRLKTKGDRAFSVNAPRLWKQLPLDCRLALIVLYSVMEKLALCNKTYHFLFTLLCNLSV